MKIALLAKGPTLKKYPGPDGFDEVWGLNQLAQSYKLDKLFVMDDLIYRMPAWDSKLPEWLKSYDGTIITSRAYGDWPTAVEYPLQDICNTFGLPLGMCMYSTVDYMLALAIHQRVDEIDLFGIDCSNPKREERTRVSIAMWIGIAQASGIKVTSYPGSFYQWYTVPGVAYEQGLYGYAGPPRIEELRKKEVREDMERFLLQKSYEHKRGQHEDSYTR